MENDKVDINVKIKYFNNAEKIWWYLGTASLFLVTYYNLGLSPESTPFFPLPIYLFIACFSWFGANFAYILTPVIYFLLFPIIFKYGNPYKNIFVISILIGILDIILFIYSWNYGIKYQGAFYTIVVAVENIIGFTVIFILLYLSYFKRSRNYLYGAFYSLLFILSWCAFPVLGEMP